MAFAQSLPPLLPGEVYTTTQNGCGVILDPVREGFAAGDAEIAKKAIARLVWTGTCPNGLADGVGAFGESSFLKLNPDFKREFAYGRQLGKSISPGPSSGVTYTIYRMGGRLVQIPNIANPYAPRWSENSASNTSLSDADNVSVRTEQNGCFVDQGAFPGCDLKNDFQVYGMTVVVKGKEVTTWCANPKTANGCEATWQEKAGPIIARIKAFVAETEKQIAEDKRKYAELTLPWIKAETQQKLANAAEAERLAALETTRLEGEKAVKAASLEKDKTMAAAAQRERDEFDARERQKAEKAEKAFQASLKKLNAGELFALADKTRSDGDTVKAREILRTLITKFPNNPLVAVAAQQMSQLPPPAPAAVAVAAAAKPQVQNSPSRPAAEAAVPDRILDTVTKATKQEFLACRGAILRSCFSPSQCKDKDQQAPCVQVAERCDMRVLGKGNDGGPALAVLSLVDSGGVSSWSSGDVIDASDLNAFRALTWEKVMSDPDAGHTCVARFEVQAFIEHLGTAAEKAALGVPAVAAGRTASASVDGASAAGGGGNRLPATTSSGRTGGSGSPDPKRSRKVNNPAADARGCSKLIPSTEWIGKSAMGGSFRFVNDCPTKVEFFWCSDNECTRNGGNTWTVAAGGNWPVSGTNVRWGACRGANSGGFDVGSQGQKYTCPLLKW